jgi:hypothetical protein
MARDLSILLVCSRSQRWGYPLCVLQHAFLWDCHIYKGLSDSISIARIKWLITSSIRTLSLDYLFMSRDPWLEFSSNPSYENHPYILKTTAFLLDMTEWNKHHRLNCEPAKYLLSTHQGHLLNSPKVSEALLQRYCSIIHDFEMLALILNFIISMCERSPLNF